MVGAKALTFGVWGWAPGLDPELNQPIKSGIWWRPRGSEWWSLRVARPA